MNFNDILSLLPTEPTRPKAFWTNGESILGATEEQISAIADLIDSMEIGDAVTGYYDPNEDERNNEVNECTGFYYVTC